MHWTTPKQFNLSKRGEDKESQGTEKTSLARKTHRWFQGNMKTLFKTQQKKSNPKGAYMK